MSRKEQDQSPSVRYWRSQEALEQAPHLVEALQREFPPDATELEVRNTEVDRRKFLGLMGASAALAGGALSGCIRKPREQILPYADRPEDLIPGKPRFYATSAWIAGSVAGLLVESQDGRPTKIEGNPKHPSSRGASSAWAQAEVLNLYDPDRSRTPLRGGKQTTWAAFEAFAQGHFSKLSKNRGNGIALLTEYLPSPTYQRMLSAFRRRFPDAKLYVHDAAMADNAAAGSALTDAPAVPHYRLDRARVVLSLDADLLGSEGEAVRNARQFAAGRAVRKPGDTMNRLYVAEPFYTPTGAMADHRLALRSGDITALAAAVGASLLAQGLSVPAGAEALARQLPTIKSGVARVHSKWIKAVAKDLLAHKGRCVIAVGGRQSARVHGLVRLLNTALGNAPATIQYDDGGAGGATLFNMGRPFKQLRKALTRGRVQTLVIVGTNPAYSSPGFATLLAKAKNTVHLSSHVDETSAACTWHLPRSHALETWGDWRAAQGTLSVQQPLIAPLHGSRSELELLALMSGQETHRGYELVRATWDIFLGRSEFDSRWRRILHDGLWADSPATRARPAPRWEGVTAAWEATTALGAGQGLELNLRLDPKVFDGRYANNGWLQELPDATSKLTWDNAAYLSTATARKLGVKSMDRVKLSLGQRALELAAFVVPGTADDAVVVSLGYGRQAGGKVAQGVGFNAYALRDDTEYFAAGATLTRVGKRRLLLASTQDHGSMEGRPIIREGTLAQYNKDPEFAKKAVKHPPLKSAWTEPHERGGHQWGMSIDLSACNGCNACVVACQAENNVPVVGKQRVMEGREMHWLRMDRYFSGDQDSAEMVVQPMGCVHCEMAPCEGVCPVAATTHSPEGLNDMAYNRCIGTRYCSNNCPFKVRRFNFFQYNGDLSPLDKMQKNPDVTVRFRGVMEKCTYCVQRINEAKIAAKRDGDGTVTDGTIQPACAQACPTRAIAFGDLNDRKSEVSRRKAMGRDYAVLSELNIKPRTTYLARLRNPNPELAGGSDKEQK